MIARTTVAPAKCRARRSSTIAWYSGLPLAGSLSRSPMWMRMRVRSPLKPCIAGPPCPQAGRSVRQAPCRAASAARARNMPAITASRESTTLSPMYQNARP